MKPNYLKNAWRLSIGVTVLIVLLIFVFNGFDFDVFTHYKKIAVGFVYSVTLTFVNYFFFIGLGKKYDWETQAKKRFIIGLLGSIVLTILAYGFCRFAQLVLIEQQETATQFFATEKMENYFFPFLVTVIVSLFMHAIYFYKAIQESKVNEQKIIAGTASAKFDALKNQLDPHFLFNSLNVLTALIDENPEAAQNFTTGLSKIYRYVLEQKNKDLVSLDAELKFAKTYIDLLKMRFENGICCSIPEKVSNSEAKIVPLSLQLVIENAVKHNSFSEDNPLKISIEETDGFLTVTNNLRSKKSLEKGSGVGLQNIRQRYELLSHKEVEVEKTLVEYSINLPILTKDTVFSKIEISVKEEKENTRERIKTQVESEKYFRLNLIGFLIVVPILIVVNLYGLFYGNSHHLWLVFPLFGWGIAVSIHYFETFRHKPVFGKSWEAKKIDEFLNQSKSDGENTTERQRYREAKTHVEDIGNFYRHISLYVFVMILLAILNYYDNGFSYLWFLWPLGGWGIGMAFKAASAFGVNPFFNTDWEKRKIEKYMEEEEEEKPPLTPPKKKNPHPTSPKGRSEKREATSNF